MGPCRSDSSYSSAEKLAYGAPPLVRKRPWQKGHAYLAPPKLHSIRGTTIAFLPHVHNSSSQFNDAIVVRVVYVAPTQLARNTATMSAVHVHADPSRGSTATK